MAELASIIDAIMRPLRFASKDNFARMGSLRGLEELISTLCDRALGVSSSADPSGFFLLKTTLKDFDSLSTEEKKARLTEAIGLVDSLSKKGEAEAPPESVTVRSLDEVASALKMLKTPLKAVKGIGPAVSMKLERKGLRTVEDLLYFLPIRYEDRRNLRKIRELAPGTNGLFLAEVMTMGEVRYGKRKVFEMIVGDGTGFLRVKWFNYRLSYMKRFTPGQKLSVYGPVSSFGGRLETIHPEIEVLDDEDASSSNTCRVMPVYSQVENLRQKTVRRIAENVVASFAKFAEGGVPAGALKRNGLMDLKEAICDAHMPEGLGEGEARPEKAMKSLVFDELFTLELGLSLKRSQVKKESGIHFLQGGESALEKKLRGALPFTLTRAQERVLGDIRKDMRSPYPMNRLIQGDVGSGKTVVSIIASLWAIESGYQVALMAPTEILAEQHFLLTRRYAEATGIRTLLLRGGLPAPARRNALEAIRTGEADLVIGTHALIQKDVDFKALGLAVIDEQHRFGVVQRAALKKKAALPDGLSPDILIMTATPIPRTLAMTVFGDLDVSVIDELPPGRKAVETLLLRERDRAVAYGTIKRELSAGGQAYVVYPLVSESEELSLRDATNMKEHLERDVFPEFRLGLLHGRMKSQEKEAVMKDFKERKLDILVCTTVIEVGVDVPNASVMFIEHAERFGLAQLHQLRGRVGRGERKSVCILLAQWTKTEDTLKRLRVFTSTQDGFRIAEEDLKIRGPGDYLGSRQSGLPDFRISGVLGDMQLLKKAREEALSFLSRTSLEGPEASCIKEVLKARWEGRLELAEVG